MNESAPQVNARMMNLLQKIPLLNTFSSYDFERIRIPLFMITSEFDVCMDQNIELGRRWTGKEQL